MIRVQIRTNQLTTGPPRIFDLNSQLFRNFIIVRISSVLNISIKVMISMDEGDDKKLASCFVENGIMEIVKVRALRITVIHLDRLNLLGILIN